MKLSRFFNKSTFLVFVFSLLVAFCGTLHAQEFYWENPERITTGDSRFPRAASNGNSSAVLWQEIDTKKSEVYISGAFYFTDDSGSKTQWKYQKRFAGPFSYSGVVPDLYSVAMNKDGKIVVSVVAEPTMISVFTSSDGGVSFVRNDFEKTELPLVAPRVYALKSGEFILFASLGKDESFSMLSSKSKDGIAWQKFSSFDAAKSLTNPFLPVLVSGSDGELVLFQAQLNNGSRLSYQLYSTRSKTNGTSWSAAELVTDQSSVLNSDRDYFSYHNQRPTLFSKDGKYFVAWERSFYSSENSNIYFAEIDFSTGKISSSLEEITSSGNASRPVLFDYGKKLSLVWFDTRQGAEAVFFSQKEGRLWNESKLSQSGVSSIFAYPLITNNNSNLSFVWQSNNSIYRLSADTSVKPPSLKPLTYSDGKHSKNKKVKYRVVLPQDSSGIAGFAWTWTQDKEEVPALTLTNLPKDNVISVNADTEGEYYFKVCALDYAGNWSEPSSISYYLDLTPPPSPVITLSSLDEFGFVSSNSFKIQWNVDSDNVKEVEDVAGYSWVLTKVENLEKKFLVSKRHPLATNESIVQEKIESLNEKYSSDKISSKISAPPKRIMQKKDNVQFSNYSNGVYIFAVRAIDEVGNVGEASYIPLYLNKFEPYTTIRSLKKSTDIFGNTTIKLEGFGFTYDGIISDIIIKAENSKEEAVHLKYANGDYKIKSNNSITDIKLSNQLQRGKYYISLKHSDRGIFNSNIAFSISENGTVKIEKEYEYIPNWKGYLEIGKYSIQVSYILFVILMFLSLSGFILAIRGIVVTIKSFNLVKLEILALEKGDVMPLQKKHKEKVLTKKSVGLRLKLILFTVILVLMVSLLVSLPLGFIMVQTQEHSLSKGLEDRVNLLLENLTTRTKGAIPSAYYDDDVGELSAIPAQSSALDEANFVTVTGYASDKNDRSHRTRDNYNFDYAFENSSLDYIWATNDENVLNKVNDEQLQFIPGSTQVLITQSDMLQIIDTCKNINKDAVEKVEELKNDSNIMQNNLGKRIAEVLDEFSSQSGSSFPLYNSEKLDRTNTEYLFYRPVLYRSSNSDVYVRAIVFISVSTKSLIRELDSSTRVIIYTASGIALFAIIVGTICAILLASIIVNPIRRLAKHVQMIGKTVDKEKLAGKEIIIKSKDEIGQLGETVNEMTRGLVKAALDEKLLMDGKVVQQTFLPLSIDNRGNKQTTANIKDGALEFVGYYEGASGVSGDYFDYKKLDDRWHVIIKCDVSGHGVPAALLMTVVATLFRKHFENWNFKQNGTDLSKLVCTINDFIEGLGIKGKFATIILSLVDTKTGDVYMCNAGDNVVHIFDSVSRKQKVLTLQETPAAGPLPTFMVEMKGGFKLEKTHLNKGDILFLYTDGIEEATRKFRDSSFNVIKCEEPGLKDGDIHANHAVGLDSEQMDPERVSAIIEAALNKQVYVLEKYHNPIPNEQLEFDFSKLDGTAQDAILALCSVEKVFRFYKDGDVSASDMVRVDKKIDGFLKKCFNRYDYYCSNQKEIGEESPYLYYTNLKEDEQLDDLTLVALKM